MMKCAFLSFALFLISFTTFAQRIPGREYPVYCDNDRMISNEGRIIFQFVFSSECREALNESRMNFGRFCAREKLMRPDGSEAHTFTFSSECKEALMELRQPTRGLFCDDGNLISLYRGILSDMTFQSRCRDALREVVSYRGLFCDEGVMKDFRGRILQDYTFNSRCRSALPVVSRDHFRKMK